MMRINQIISRMKGINLTHYQLRGYILSVFNTYLFNSEYYKLRQTICLFYLRFILSVYIVFDDGGS